MSEWNVWADIEKNRLYIVLRGYFTVEEAKTAADLTIEAAMKLRPGFDCITDLSAHKPSSDAVNEETRRAQMFLAERGVRRVVRVVTTSVLSQMQFERVGKQAGYQDGTSDVASSLEEAERKLEQSGAE